MKYAASVLGAVWSLLNPLVYLAVFTFVAKVLGAGIPNYPVYLLSGLLAWNLFSASMGPRRAGGPRQREPGEEGGVRARDPAALGRRRRAGRLRAAVGGPAACTSWSPGTASTCPSSPCGRSPSSRSSVLTVALSLWFSALNVRYRDVGHLAEHRACSSWFWATPIVYAEFQVQQLAEGRRARGSGSRAWRSTC